jgi:hypothetical protein
MEIIVPDRREIDARAAEIRGALRELRGFYAPDATEPGSELGIAVSVLEALRSQDGPISTLATVLEETSEFFTGFDSEDGNRAADYLTDAADSVRDALRTLALAIDAAASIEA